MALLIVPDVHGRTFWEGPVDRFMHQVDKIIFLGDYLDPYPKETDVELENVLDNFEKIIRLKRENPELVVLLKGNHDEHYSSETFQELAGGTRCDYKNWKKYHELFGSLSDLFQLAYYHRINGVPYIFSHAGITTYWLKKVNRELWKMPEDQVSIADPLITDKINQLDFSEEGQKLLAVIGRSRSTFGEKTGSILWADVSDHETDSVNSYGFNQSFQIFGHTRLKGDLTDMIQGERFAMIDSQKCFLLDWEHDGKLKPVRE